MDTKCVPVDELIPLRAAIQTLPHPVSDVTCWKWVKHGLRGHRLRTVKLANHRYTTLSWLRQFINEAAVEQPGKQAA